MTELLSYTVSVEITVDANGEKDAQDIVNGLLMMTPSAVTEFDVTDAWCVECRAARKSSRQGNVLCDAHEDERLSGES